MATVLQYGLSLTTGAFTGPMRLAQGTVKGFTSQLSNIGNIVTGFASIPGAINTLVAPLTKPITLASDVEVLGKSFKTLLGSGQEAAKMLKDVTHFAGSTPFQITEVAPAAKQLLAFGFAANQVLPLMKDIGDMSALMDKPINEVADAFGRLKSGQFGEAFERMRAFGLSMKDLQGAGLVFDKSGSFVGSADQAIEAVRQIIRRKFGGGMKEISSTFKGQFSNFTDSWEQLQTNFGKPITAALTPVLSEATKNIGDWTPAASNFGKTLATGISGAFALFKSGEIGKTLQSAFIGLNKAIFSNIGVGLGAAMKVGAEVLRGSFKSAINLFTDGGFWQSIKFQFLSVAESFRSVILSTMADAVDSLPTAFRLGANTKEMRQQAGVSDQNANAYAYSASYVAGKINFEEITAPMISSASAAGTILGDTITQIATNLKNIPEFATIAENLKSAAAGPAPQIGGASLYDLVPPEKKREFLPTNEPFQFDRGQGIGNQAALMESVQKLLAGTQKMAENFFNPKGIGSGEGPKAADIKKSLDDSGLIKRLLTVLEQVQVNTSNLGQQGVYAAF